MRRLSALAALLVMLGSCFDDDVTIVDNTSGGANVLTIVAVDAAGSESGDTGTFAVIRAGDTSQALTVNLIVGGSATDGVDYLTLGTSMTIPAGSGIAFLTVTPIDDALAEANETVQVTLGPGTGYTVGSPAAATVTIVDNDSAVPIVTITALHATASESGDTGTFAVLRAGDSSQALTVNLTVGGTATSGTDYTVLGTTVTIPAGSGIAFLTVTPIDDALVEPNETVQVTVAVGATYAVGAPASATVTIVDNDSAVPSVTVVALDANASENGDSGTFAVLRAGNPTPALTVNVTLTGTAVNGTDYAAIPSTVSIASGAFLTVVTVTPTPDGLTEGNESVILTATAGAGYAVGTPSAATVTIADGPGLSYSQPETPAGVTGIDNEVLAADLGSDGEPRLVYRRGPNDGSNNNQIRLVRRRANGTWTTPVNVSANDSDFKNSVYGVVSRNNDFVHVFWLETPSATFDPQLHYAQLNNADPPVLTVFDTVVSAGPVAGLSGAAAFGDATSFQAVIDRSTNNVAVIWMQDVVDGGSSSIPIAGVVIAGSGAVGERFAMVIPPSSAGPGLPIIRVGPSGAIHVMYGLSVHRLRTGVQTWSNPDGAGTGSVKDLVIAPDGDAYAVCSGLSVTAAYRPAGPATTFGAPQGTLLSTNGMTQPKVVAVLEPGTEHLHAFVRDLAAAASGAPAAAVHPAANLSGSWSTISLHAPTSPVGSDAASEFVAFANPSNEVTVVFRAPAESGDLAAVVLSQSRSSGAASPYSAPVDLTAPGALPAVQLAVAQNGAGNALLAWRQGSLGTAGGGYYLAPEIFARRRASGAWSAPADNVSRSPVLPSHGPLIVLLDDAGVEHVFWDEQSIAGGPGPSDVYYARRP